MVKISKFGGGRGTPAQFFKFLVKSILWHFSNMMVKYEFILTKLTGRNNQFSFQNFHHFFKTSGLCLYWFKSIFQCPLSTPKKCCVDRKKLSSFNKEISFAIYNVLICMLIWFRKCTSHPKCTTLP